QPPLRIDPDLLRQRSFISPDGERTAITEGLRRIKQRILADMRVRAAGPRNLIMITSALPGEGKTFCAINLAISLAMELEHSVLLVDADNVRPNVLESLGLEPKLPGLMDVLGDRTLSLSDVVRSTSIEKLSVLPAGSPHRNSTELLASDAMRRLVADLTGRFGDRIVIFDSPPLLVASESAALASHMSQILLVAAAKQTTVAALGDALSRLEGCQGKVALVLNKGDDTGAGYGYYGYGYGDGLGRRG
ncbi:MAG: XrtA-associated tyrosine autokinase, partial [Casimicrobiaceae bacterium]